MCNPLVHLIPFPYNKILIEGCDYTTALVIAMGDLSVAAANTNTGYTGEKTVPCAQPIDQSFYLFPMQSESDEPNL